MQKRKNFIYVFLFFIFLCVVVFFLFKLPFLKPVSSVTQAIFSPLTSTVHSIFRLNKSSKDKSLQEQNLDFSKKLIDQTKILQDNKALRDQFETESVKSSSLIPATIVGSPSFIPGVTLPESYVLNKGIRDGIRIGQSVVYKDNLVGKIVEVSDGFSKATLLTAQNFSTTAKTLSTDALGVAKGQGGGEMILDNVVLSQSIKNNDLVITKGTLDTNGVGILPDLVIGKVISVNKNPSSLFQIAKIKTLLNFATLSKVFIIKN